MKDKAAQSLGKRGGQKTASLYGKDHFSEAGKKGMAKRWCKHEWVDHWDAQLPGYICSKCGETKPKQVKSEE